MQLIPYLAKHTQLPEKNIRNTVELLEEDCTIPFISRYRKEKTGNLDEVQIGAIVACKAQFENLEKRKTAIFKAIEEQGQLTAELREQIDRTEDLISLEDLYLPFKKKRKTKAETARKNGLEPLAKMIMAQNHRDIASAAMKFTGYEVPDEEAALEGAGISFLNGSTKG